MTKIVYPLLVIVSLIAFSSCSVRVNKERILNELDGRIVNADGEDTTKTVFLDSFSSISAEGFIDVEFVYSDLTKAEIHGPGNVVESVEISNDNGTVNVRILKKVVLIGGQQLLVTIYGASVSRFNLSGSGDIKAQEIHEDSFEMSIEGSGDVNIESLSAKALNVNISGSGDMEISGMDAGKVESLIIGSGEIKFSGKAESLDVQVDGSGSVDIKELECSKVSNTISGSGEIIR